MNADKSISATFTEVSTSQYTLSTAVSGSGSITLSPSGGVYNASTVVTVTATPDNGWQFDEWSGDLSGSTNPTTINMNANYSVTATFSEITNGEICDNPTSISIPFTQNGVGEYCWVTSDNIAYVNSWNMATLEINGVDYTNTWSGTMPDKIDGNYYIYYHGLYDWSHFEAPQTKSAMGIDDGNTIKVYPNPFTEYFNLDISHPEQVKRIVISDELGRNIGIYEPSAITDFMSIGQNLEIGTYLIKVYSKNGIQSFVVSKSK